MLKKFEKMYPNRVDPQKPHSPYTLGLDIGIASVGWAVLGDTRIIDLGVRCFDKAETSGKDGGKSLNLARRAARLTRRRVWRRSWRLTKLGRVLKNNGLIQDADFFKNQPSFTELDPADIKKKKQIHSSAWQLRVEGLNRLLTPQEWARVIYHLCKHRGFHWVSKAEERETEDEKSENGKVKKALANTKALMAAKNYRTAAQMVLAEFPDAQRNKHGDYSKALSRMLLDQELATLFLQQRNLGNAHASESLEVTIRGNGDRKSGLFWAQQPMQSVLHMLGRCTFEPKEFRAPKASFSAERHVWLTRLNNLRITEGGKIEALNEAQRSAALLMPYESVEKFTYKSLKNGLIKKGLMAKSTRFMGLTYPRGDEKTKDPEDQSLVKLSGWHDIKKTLLKHGLESEWLQISVAALDDNPEYLDEIAWALSVFKDDTQIEFELQKLNLPNSEKTVDALLGLRFDKFHSLSIKALRKIVPYMAQGFRYDEAVIKADYDHHSQRFTAGAGAFKYLPPFYDGRTANNGMKFREDIDIPRNPVVLRALNQARKVVNALIRQYGSPASVNIEMARDLSRPLDERRDIEKLQHEFRDRNEKLRLDFETEFQHKPTGAEFEKIQLYREQHGKCAYSLTPLDLHRVLDEPNYVQIDHALPYSRSYDNSKNNKVLVLTLENQNKGNRTPYEYLTSFEGGENGSRWRNFSAAVEGNKNYRQAKRNRLLRQNFGEDEASSFRERNLNDTRYICKFFKNYVEQNLQLAEASHNKRCVVVNGQLTAFLRARWGFLKIREESDRHHALDAVVVAACSHSMVKRLADHSKRKEIEYLREGFADPETGEIINAEAAAALEKNFPRPWAHFRDEVEIRLKTDDPVALRQKLVVLGTYDQQALQEVKPLFVSRAPKRRGTGAAHKDTVYAKAPTQEFPNRVTEKVALSSLTLKDLDRLVDPHRNEKLYAAIRARLETYAANGGKFTQSGNTAFPISDPLRKPDKVGNPTGPIVRTVTMATENMSGIPLRGGLAKNDSMVRVDVFKSKKDGKFHLVPVYVHHLVTGLPNRAVVAFKDETEWTLMDECFYFLFSLYPNELVKISLKNEIRMGYYAGCNRATGSIDIWAHDRNLDVGKAGLIQSVGVKVANNFEKLNVDVLGNVYPTKPELRHGLA